ncbi:uncharacterized protein LOC102631384 isoform X2 [Citrus sinensis]|uniref:uncharacterized protein LOC102631384 isoform X2 n=1 Tax=Citrus sinensis TaxID=2711 RepID=UPI000D625349|nr:uncharacterized protein LOC102631384 isoform X2 [Citrus sinensis]
MEAESLSSQIDQSDNRSIEGMESVVATVSGYHGTERFNLIKLISYSGASYVGTMSKSTTHLVCWKFEGEKHSLAKKFRTIIVNHQWVEDCIKQHRRLPERPYMLQSGQEIGPLLLEVPLFNMNSDRSNLDDNSKNEETDMRFEVSELAGWKGSFLLNENLLPKFGKSENTSHKCKSKSFKRASKQEQRSSARNCFQDPPLSGLIRMESLREKTKISKGIGSSSSAKPSTKGRRLAKCIGRNGLESMLLDSDQDRAPVIRIAETSDDGFHKDGGINEGSEDIKEIEERDFPALLQRESQDGCSGIENSNGMVKNTERIEHVNQSSASGELSCVICWTEFSSTRGVLACGHRFCYSCIQNWADHMASVRKISTCPLCKASFMSITKVEDAATSDQKIYSQTIPCAWSTRDVFILPDGDSASVQLSLLEACIECRSQEPQDLLIRCHLCQSRCIHCYCMDPPLDPWTCIHCKDLQMLYNRSNF